jgi:hypothetical protein
MNQVPGDEATGGARVRRREFNSSGSGALRPDGTRSTSWRGVPDVKECPERIQKHNVQVDGDEEGYLLQKVGLAVREAPRAPHGSTDEGGGFALKEGR